ncbi:hypothetical protein BAE44_0003223 [Dichanthelium oligosanthes]|uniref:Protein TIC 20 n=1 Tax=Dichanthelium oligosanthes TaxID=888268 RepID=A0A1E5WEP6_9POAL|nr:hypothetical protein BAE44_0003223 [Dichanthelium oligosanthes]
MRRPAGWPSACAFWERRATRILAFLFLCAFQSSALSLPQPQPGRATCARPGPPPPPPPPRPLHGTGPSGLLCNPRRCALLPAPGPVQAPRCLLTAAPPRASNNNDPSGAMEAPDRLVAAVAYLYPFLDGADHGRFLLAQFPHPLAPAARLFHSSPLMPFLLFLTLYITVVRNQQAFSELGRSTSCSRRARAAASSAARRSPRSPSGPPPRSPPFRGGTPCRVAREPELVLHRRAEQGEPGPAHRGAELPPHTVPDHVEVALVRARGADGVRHGGGGREVDDRDEERRGGGNGGGRGGRAVLGRLDVLRWEAGHAGLGEDLDACRRFPSEQRRWPVSTDSNRNRNLLRLVSTDSGCLGETPCAGGLQRPLAKSLLQKRLKKTITKLDSHFKKL